jgi:multidrug resistance protein
VTWKGEDDPLNPLNWTKNKKWVSTILVSSFTFISPIASTMVAPALEDIADEFGIQTNIERVMVMSIFLLAYAVGPFLLGPLSEVFGRVVVLQGANAFFLLFNFACGFARTKSQMMAFRFLSGLGGSAPQAIGGGVLSDCWRAEERGTALAVYSLAPFLGPAVGPIAGGYITQYTTWRWIFHSTSIFDLLIQLLAFLFLKETYHPAILAKKCKALRKSTGNTALHTKYQRPDKTVPKLLQKAMVRPFIMLTTQPALQAMAIYRAYGYGLMYLMFSTFPMIFKEQYRMSVGTASLNYISLGVGFVLGLQISGPLQDKVSFLPFPSLCLLINVNSYTNISKRTPSTPPAPCALSTAISAANPTSKSTCSPSPPHQYRAP